MDGQTRIVTFQGSDYLDGPEGLYYDVTSDQVFILKSKRFSIHMISRYAPPIKLPSYKMEFDGVTTNDWIPIIASSFIVYLGEC